MAARITYWFGFLSISSLCALLLFVNDKLAQQNLVLTTYAQSPHNVDLIVWTDKVGNVYVVADERFGHMYPLMCAKMGFRSL